MIWLVRIEAGDRLVDARRRLTALVASHAQIRIVVAAVDGNAAGKRHLGNRVTRIGQHVGVAVRAGECVRPVAMANSCLLAGIQARHSQRGSANKPQDFLLLIPVVEGLAVAVEMTFTHLDMGTGGLLCLLFDHLRFRRPGAYQQHSNHTVADLEMLGVVRIGPSILVDLFAYILMLLTRSRVRRVADHLKRLKGKCSDRQQRHRSRHDQHAGRPVAERLDDCSAAQTEIMSGHAQAMGGVPAGSATTPNRISLPSGLCANAAIFSYGTGCRAASGPR